MLRRPATWHSFAQQREPRTLPSSWCAFGCYSLGTVWRGYLANSIRRVSEQAYGRPQSQLANWLDNAPQHTGDSADQGAAEYRQMCGCLRLQVRRLFGASWRDGP